MEVWKEIPGYEEFYMASNLGRIKSLERITNIKNGYTRLKKESILKQQKDSGGYLQVNLTLHGKAKGFKVHQLICMAFYGHIPNKFNKEVCDHINYDKTDNRLTNLRVVSSRFNVSRRTKGKTSKYVGVYYDSTHKKYRATITINKRHKCLGYFYDEKEAKKAYNKKVNELNDRKIISCYEK